MIDRYTRPEMGTIWSDKRRFQAWLDVELATCAAWSKLGVIPEEDVERLYANATFDIDRIHEIEHTTRHDVVAFTRAVSESLGEEKKWVHYGLTSSDVVDTALMILLKEANDLLLRAIDRLLDILAEKAREHKHTLMMGRTHGVHAEPITWGLKLALYHTEMTRNRRRFEAAADDVAVGKLSGAVGTFAHTPPEVEQMVCQQLGLRPAPVSTQILQRDRHAHYLSVLALIGASLEKMAIEIRGLQRSEVGEVEEAFGKGQKGSSAMPHKRNPIGCENITGCARLLRGYMVAGHESVALWHERDISHSSVERVVLPDATTILHYALHRFAEIMEHLVVFPDAMRENMERSYGIYHSQRLLLLLIDKGMSREEAYDRVQPAAMKAWEEGRAFRETVEESEAIAEILLPEEIDKAFDSSYFIRRVDVLFERAGLRNPPLPQETTFARARRDPRSSKT